jgi:hypothetical protein
LTLREFRNQFELAQLQGMRAVVECMIVKGSPVAPIRRQPNWDDEAAGIDRFPPTKYQPFVTDSCEKLVQVS